MGKKIELDEEFVIKEYLDGKSSLVLCEELGVSKPVILKILKKHNVTRKKDRCSRLKIEEENGRFYVLRKCPMCNKVLKTTSKDKVIACRNHYNNVNNNSTCKTCMGKKNNGEGNPFFGKKHTEETKKKLSDTRKGKGMGDDNAMSNPKWRKKASTNLKKKWDSGEMEHVRKIMSDTLKKTRLSGKITSVIRSKQEKKIITEIEKMGYDVNHSLRVECKIFDIHIPSLNLVIEYNGDYWHCNPKKYPSDYYHQVKRKTAKELWEYDKKKIDLIKSKGYNLEVVWESDVKDDKSLINKLIKKYDKR